MTSAAPADQLPDRDDVLAAHFAAVARMHQEALAHLDALADSLVESAERATETGPETQQIALLSSKPPVRTAHVAA